MANVNCQACEDLREVAPSLACGGFTDDMCTSLQNDTGLTASSGNNDCTDLDNMNDCLIGNEDANVELFEVCDWKKFMHEFIPNLWTMLKAIICAICGIWTNIHNLWKLANRIDCIVDYLMNGASFSFGEMSEDTTSYIVAGKGVSFANVSQSGTAADIKLTYIAGGMAHISGSLLLYDSNFTDAKSVYNYDSGGVNPTKSSSRQGNSLWDSHDVKPTGGSQLAYELRIKKSEFPQIKRFFGGIGLNEDGGGFHTAFAYFNEGSYAYGQNGHCDRNNGDPANSDSSRGHLVPSGWMYIQCRITWIDDLNGDADGAQYTPAGFLGIRMNQNAIEC